MLQEITGSLYYDAGSEAWARAQVGGEVIRLASCVATLCKNIRCKPIVCTHEVSSLSAVDLTAQPQPATSDSSDTEW